jgi:hypothetical protein
MVAPKAKTTVPTKRDAVLGTGKKKEKSHSGEETTNSRQVKSAIRQASVNP